MWFLVCQIIINDKSCDVRAIIATASSRINRKEEKEKNRCVYRGKVGQSITVSRYDCAPSKTFSRGSINSTCFTTIKLTCTFVDLLTQQPNTVFGANTLEIADTKVGRCTNRTGRRREREREKDREKE